MLDLNPINVLMITVEIKKRHPCHNLTQTYGGIKSICMVGIRPTENSLTELSTSFSMNEQ